jgi:hypothetical protein
LKLKASVFNLTIFGVPADKYCNKFKTKSILMNAFRYDSDHYSAFYSTPFIFLSYLLTTSHCDDNFFAVYRQVQHWLASPNRVSTSKCIERLKYLEFGRSG